MAVPHGKRASRPGDAKPPQGPIHLGYPERGRLLASERAPSLVNKNASPVRAPPSGYRCPLMTRPMDHGQGDCGTTSLERPPRDAGRGSQVSFAAVLSAHALRRERGTNFPQPRFPGESPPASLFDLGCRLRRKPEYLRAGRPSPSTHSTLPLPFPPIVLS